MDFRSNSFVPTFTRLHAQLNHLNNNDRAWGQEIAVSIDMASVLIESVAKQYSIPENCISINIVMDNFKDGTLH